MPYAVCVRRKKKRKKRNPAALKTHQNQSNTATAANSKRRTARQVPRVSPSSPACLDAGFVEIGYVQLSQSMVMRKNADRQYKIDRLLRR